MHQVFTNYWLRIIIKILVSLHCDIHSIKINYKSTSGTIIWISTFLITVKCCDGDRGDLGCKRLKCWTDTLPLGGVDVDKVTLLLVIVGDSYLAFLLDNWFVSSLLLGSEELICCTLLKPDFSLPLPNLPVLPVIAVTSLTSILWDVCVIPIGDWSQI